ncbi:exported hypothetical protein [metagenome]|uniref:Fibronectin type-III domain-containing protein n=1 Tax=metagenome TaxID=256318 RepID=A0A2P2C7W8_9ZZZZ
MPVPQIRRLPRRLAGTVVLALLASTPSVGAVAQTDPDPGRGQDTHLTAAPRLLDGPARGERAIRRLGDRLAVAAARNDLRAGELRSLLRNDTTAWVDEDGRVYFVEPAPEASGPGAPTAPAVAPLSETFSLHSNPGASLTIFLDVDGADVSGTAWNSNMGVTSGQHPAWDPAGDGAGFSDDELLMVQEVWAIVAEDYAPFDVDVTTADPGYDGLVRTGSLDTTYGTRVLVSPSTDAITKICGGECGGVAYVGSFNQVGTAYQPAWVFPQALGDHAKYVAEAASHEAGHNLGLEHHGAGTAAYYAGHGSWAPIMGAGYSKSISQWSHGAYLGANNTAQDDVATIAARLGRRSDEAPGPGSAPATLPTGTAFITSATDVDSYLLGSCTSGSQVSVSPAAVAPNLDVRATLRAADGGVVATSAPVSGLGDLTTATGLGATLTVPITAAGWTVSVEGVGEGDWSTGGYDDYGSLGAYTVSAPGCQDTPLVGAPGAPQAAAVGSITVDALTLSWDAPVDAGASPVTSYVVRRSGSTDVWTLPATARSHVFTGLAGATSYALSVRAVNGSGAGPAASVQGATLAPPPTVAAPNAPTLLTVRPGDGSATGAWTVPQNNGSPITGYTVIARAAGLPTQTLTVPASVTTAAVTGLTNNVTWSMTVTASSALGTSAESRVLTVVPTALAVPALPPTTTPTPTATAAPGRMAALSVTVRNRRVVARWSAAKSPGSLVTKYVLDISRGRDRTATGGARKLSFGKLPRGSYRIRIAAVNAVGRSPYSAWTRVRVR